MGEFVRVVWHEDAIRGALATLLDYRDGNIGTLIPSSRPVMVAIDALRAIVNEIDGQPKP